MLPSLVCVCVYLVVNSDLRVGVSFIQGFDFTNVVLQRKLDHLEHHWHLCWQFGELQLTAQEREGSRKS